MDEMTRRDLEMMKLMSSPEMDVEVFGRSDTYRIMCENKAALQYGFENEGSKEVIAYWEARGLRKELHGVDPEKPWTKWASYLPMSYVHGENPEKTYPLLFVLHGAGNPIFLAESYGYTNIAAREELIVIIPEDETPASIEKLMAFAFDNYPVDRTRVYMVGYSLGGFMTSRHALRWPERFAAVGVGGMIFANGESDAHEQAGLLWPGENTTVEMAKRAAQFSIPVCNCMGEYEVLGLIPVTRDEPKNEWTGQPDEKNEDASAEDSRDARQDDAKDADPAKKPPKRIDLSGTNKIRSINNWRIANGCTEIPEEEVRRAAAETADIVVEKIGFPFERTSVEVRENRSHYIGDCVSADGEVRARFIGLAKSPHWPSQALCDLVWEFISQFKLDPVTGKSYRA